MDLVAFEISLGGETQGSFLVEWVLPSWTVKFQSRRKDDSSDDPISVLLYIRGDFEGGGSHLWNLVNVGRVTCRRE